MASNTTYTIHTNDVSASVRYNTASPGTWTRGETTTYEFEFPRFYDSLTVTDTYTVNGIEGYDSVTVEAGATLTVPAGSRLQTSTLTDNGTVDVDGTLVVNSAFAELLPQYTEWAGSYAPLESLTSVQRYRTQLPDSIPISSLVWGIEPAESIRGRGQPGVWGLVDSVSNERTQSLSTHRFRVEVLVLGRYSEFADVTDVRSQLEV